MPTGDYADEPQLVAALRAGDENAFLWLMQRYQAPLTRVALCYVADQATAEDVVQETWLAVLQGLGRFAGRASLKTWLFTVLTNRAKTRGQREARSVPFSAWGVADEAQTPTVDPDRFWPPDHPEAPGHWANQPARWEDQPEATLLAQETQAQVRAAIAALPPNQRAVITLHDVEGFSSTEVCNFLGLSETNQRVLLHRARAKVRQALENYFAPAPHA